MQTNAPICEPVAETKKPMLEMFRNMYKHTGMDIREDTIAAIATAPGTGGIAILRISGPDAFRIADEIFRCKPPCPSARPANQVVYGHVQDAGQDIDEALLLPFRAPASYTREDVVEFHVHGGSMVAQQILHTILQYGARLADPGEFTRRAFLAGRIDLLQAEAVMDLISAKSKRAARAAVEQLEGSLSQAFLSVYEGLLAVAADLEAQLDFAEDELPAHTTQALCTRLHHEHQQIQALAETADEGHRLREGTLVVIAGRPNAGKSTLLNALLQKDRAIVTAIPGTTRDSLEETMLLDGFPLRLVDTAGLRKADCVIEQEGIRRTVAQIDRADVILLILDASTPLSAAENDLLTSCDASNTIVLLNKYDITQAILPEQISNFRCVSCSLLQGSGLDACKSLLREFLHISQHSEPHAVISERHQAALRTAQQAVETALHLLTEAAPSCEMLAALELRTAIEAIGNITGRVYHDDLLESIFARFCVGK